MTSFISAGKELRVGTTNNSPTGIVHIINRIALHIYKQALFSMVVNTLGKFTKKGSFIIKCMLTEGWSCLKKSEGGVPRTWVTLFHWSISVGLLSKRDTTPWHCTVGCTTCVHVCTCTIYIYVHVQYPCM